MVTVFLSETRGAAVHHGSEFLPPIRVLLPNEFIRSIRDLAIAQAEIRRRFNQNYRHHLDPSFAAGIFEIVPPIRARVVFTREEEAGSSSFSTNSPRSGSFFTGSSDPHLDYRRRRSFFDEHHNFIDPWPKNAELVHQHRRPCLAEDVDVVDIVRVRTCWRNPSPETEFLSKSLVFFGLHHRSGLCDVVERRTPRPRKTNIAEVLPVATVPPPSCFGGEEERQAGS
ncbi:hypothetical protein Droror1_Dr00009264 [Drosera rotundifolia]